VYLKEGTYHTRLFKGPGTNGMKKWDGPSRSWPTSIGIGAFRYSAALVPWTERKLQQLEAVWVQAYKWAWGLPWTTASDVFTLPSGMEYLRPLGRTDTANQVIENHL
jgi:hypothetical protein